MGLLCLSKSASDGAIPKFGLMSGYSIEPGSLKEARWELLPFFALNAPTSFEAALLARIVGSSNLRFCPPRNIFQFLRVRTPLRRLLALSRAAYLPLAVLLSFHAPSIAKRGPSPPVLPHPGAYMPLAPIETQAGSPLSLSRGSLCDLASCMQGEGGGVPTGDARAVRGCVLLPLP